MREMREKVVKGRVGCKGWRPGGGGRDEGRTARERERETERGME